MNSNLLNDLKNSILNEHINRQIIEFARSKPDIDIYIVGGYLRDLILNLHTYDMDYVVRGTSGLKFAQDLANLFNGYYIELDASFDIARVVLPDKKNYIDIAGCQGKSIEEDLSRRDFTINAMAINLKKIDSEALIDPHNGLSDIKDKTIKTISEKNIIDDPLRILRAFRISALTNSSISVDTLSYINKHLSLLNNVAKERITLELNKLFSLHSSLKYVQLLKSSGVLEEIFPDMKNLYKVPENVYHHLGLFEHTLDVYKNIEELIPAMPEKTQEHLQENITASTKRIVALKYAALLHDIGKPDTWVIDETGKHTFLGHADLGEEMSEIICKNLKLPNSAVKRIAKLVKYHLYPSQLSNNFQPPSKKAKFRFFRKLGDEVPEAILLAMADRLAAQGPKISKEIVNRQLKMLEELLNDYYKTLEKTKELPKIIDGNDVMKLLNFKPSKKIGIILTEIRNRQIDGELATKEEAEKWLLENIQNISFDELEP